METTIPNFHKVCDGIYRGAQPVTSEDWKFLRSLGVTQVIKLNTVEEGSDLGAIEAGLELFYAPITFGQQFFTEPDIQAIRDVLGFITPGTFIHCGSVDRTKEAVETGDSSRAGGQDRTGVVVGLFRVLIQGWAVKAAYEEMLGCGFHRILFGLDKLWADMTKGKP